MNRTNVRIVTIAGIVAVVTFLHFLTSSRYVYYHIFFRHLYYLPVLLASFWFGIKGGLATCASVALLYPVYILMQDATWSWTPGNFERLMEMVVFLTVAFLLGALRDREKARQKALRESEALAAMGRAMAAVAHDMKTPLIAIGGFTSQVRKEFKEPDPEYQKLGIVVRETSRLENMVKSMLDFSRPLSLDLRQSDLNSLIGESVSMIEESAQQHKIAVQMELAPEVPMVSLDRMRMEQALINLGVNAVQACPEGETVTLRSFVEGKHAVVEVSDRGFGIPPEKKEEIFRPFFTTKKGGTGLGLCIVKKIIDAHEGLLEIRSDVGKGSTFRVSLPLVGPRPIRKESAPEPKTSSTE